jgi:WD40 repeat protein
VGKSFRRVVLVVALVLAVGLVAVVGLAIEAKRRRERAQIVGREPHGIGGLLPLPDGRLILEVDESASSDGRLRIRDLEPSASSRALFDELHAYFWLGRSPRELVLANSFDDRAVPSVGGLLARDIRRFPEIWNLFGFSPDGRSLLVNNKSATVDLREVPSGKLLRSFPVDDAFVATFSPDGTRFVVGTHTAELTVVDAASGEIVARLEPRPLDLWDVFFVDPEHVLSLERHALILWETTTGKMVRGFEWGRGLGVVGQADLSRDRRFLATLEEASFTLRVWDTHTLACVFERKLSDDVAELAAKHEFPRCAAFAPEQDAVFVGTNKGLVLRVPVRLPERP